MKEVIEAVEYKVEYCYESGIREATGIMVNGKRHGRWEEYDEKGNLKLSGFYFEGNPVLFFLKHSSEGSVLESWGYDFEGNPTGYHYFYDKKGKVSCKDLVGQDSISNSWLYGKVDSDGYKTMWTSSFSIKIPFDWSWEIRQGIDSQIGKIEGDEIDLGFDFSVLGFANPLSVSESAYLSEIDTIGNYYRKIVYPKAGKEGLTGIYLKNLNSSINFQLSGRNLSLENQKETVKAFKTIKLYMEWE